MLSLLPGLEETETPNLATSKTDQANRNPGVPAVAIAHQNRGWGFAAKEHESMQIQSLGDITSSMAQACTEYW